MRKNRKLYLGTGLLVAVLAAVLVHAGGGTAVETVTVRRGAITSTVEETGYVQPAEDCTLYATQAARVVRVPVEAGQPVQKGQLLVELENPDLAVQVAEARSRLSQAEAALAGARAALESGRLALAEAEKDLERVRKLWQAGAATRAEYERAQLEVQTRRQSVNEQEALLAGTRDQVNSLQSLLRQLAAKERQLAVTSPFAGVVIDLPARRMQAGGHQRTTTPGPFLFSRCRRGK